MKKSAWLIFIGYMFLLIGFGIVFEKKYYLIITNAGEKPIVNTGAKTNAYFSDQTNLYVFDPGSIANDGIVSQVNRIQSTGVITGLDLNRSKNMLVYSSQNKTAESQVWEVDLANNKSKAIIENAQGELFKNVDSFEKPRISADAKIAFLGRNAAQDTIFILSNGRYLDAIKPGFKIADYSWNNDGKKLVYCSQSLSENRCMVRNLSSNQDESSLIGEVRQISWQKTPEAIFLAKANDATNLFSSTDFNQLSQISSVTKKDITSFDLSNDGSAITYVLGNDIFFSKIDGSNPVQLTQDHKNPQAIISPAGREVLFLKQGDGIYKASTENLKVEKIINITNLIFLQVWG